ncbi:DUF3558 domain-containing protein [Streptomyces sp. NPDC004539]|uniref:DUF3558 domain-containing protein n=1 Tax=Streptomyces sp. NPDC004539 TaxID=3154280 RepID=UPI0033AB1B9D
MQRKAYVPGAAALLAALLAGCTGGSDGGGSTDNSNPGDSGTTSAAAQPGRYATLPEACGAVGRGTLDALLPGIKQLTDATQQEKAYAGTPSLTYDTDRRVGCRWKVESTAATDHLSVDFERVVSYTNTVSDDSQAQTLFAQKQDAADLPIRTSPTPSTPSTPSTSPSLTPSGTPSTPNTPNTSVSPSTSPSPTAPTTPTTPTEDIQPRVLDDLGDEAFIDDALTSSGSTAKQRTVTVAFRTSNVIVTVQYEEQPATLGTVPDSKEMQDKARKLAAQLADRLG